MSNDPYAAPTANLDNNSEAATIPTSIWTAKGRLSVLSYLGQSLILMVVGTVIIGGLFAIGAGLLGGNLPTDMESFDFSNPIVIVLGVLAALFYILLIYITICMMIKRLHDRNHSGWWALALTIGSIIPFVNIIAIIAIFYVIFFPGNKAGNRFGGRRETKGWEKVLGILYIILIVGAFVAAIAGGAAMFMGAG